VTLALSGPVGGVVACLELARALACPNVIGFDMGGTSTDISIISDYEPRSTTELSIGELPIRIPSVHVHSIGAGGGSIASLDAGGALRVGPESAGSDPGPAAYGRGGTRPTVTDCQLVLDRLTESLSLAGRLSLYTDAAPSAVAEHQAEPLGLEPDHSAAGVIEIANAAMERATRVALRERGDDPRDYTLIAFGGAGPLHATEVARRLGITTVIVPAHPGTFSALGFLGSDLRLDYAVSDVRRSDDPALADSMNTGFAMLEEQVIGEFASDGGIEDAELSFERSCEVRYVGQAYEVAVGLGAESVDRAGIETLLTRFHQLHERSYGFSSPDEACEVVTVRVAARAELERHLVEQEPRGSGAAETFGERLVHDLVLGRVPTPSYDRETLPAGAVIDGPAVVHQSDSTTFVPSFAAARVDGHGNLVISLMEERA
jgi:N-methylhydantoinase A